MTHRFPLLLSLIAFTIIGCNLKSKRVVQSKEVSPNQQSTPKETKPVPGPPEPASPPASPSPKSPAQADFNGPQLEPETKEGKEAVIRAKITQALPKMQAMIERLTLHIESIHAQPINPKLPKIIKQYFSMKLKAFTLEKKAFQQAAQTIKHFQDVKDMEAAYPWYEKENQQAMALLHQGEKLHALADALADKHAALFRAHGIYPF